MKGVSSDGVSLLTEGASRIYLDCAATTPLTPTVLAAMERQLAAPFPGDPGAVWEAARAQVASHLGAAPDRLRFTVSGTAANALAIQAAARGGLARRVLSQWTEHPSVLEPLLALEREGVQLEWLPLSRDGVVDPGDVRRRLKVGGVDLVCLMFANHETGVLQPTADVAEACRDAGALLHVDAVQGLRTARPSLALGADFMTFSAHKIQGPKGLGVLALAERAPPVPQPPMPDAVLGVGLAEALASRPSPAEVAALRASRDALEEQLRRRLPGLVVNGAGVERLASHLHVSIPGVSGEALALALDQLGVAASPGAACSSGDPQPSAGLLATGLSRELARGGVRLSLLSPLSEADMERVLLAVQSAVQRLRSLSWRATPAKRSSAG